MQDVKPNTKIYVYGIPHNYNGAYVYNNGFENSLRMTFNNNLIKGEYFEISYGKYYNLTEEIIKKYSQFQ